jgi:c-di-GMP-binding flagellar brake protein YcgR
MPILVDCIVLGGGDHETGEKSSSSASRPEGRMHARSIDLSVGGMLVAFESGDIGLADVGTRLAVNFSIAPGETPLRLKAVIKRVIRKSAAEQLRAGIEFVDLDEAFEYKIAVNRLYRYVAERQREILQMEAKED